MTTPLRFIDDESATFDLVIPLVRFSQLMDCASPLPRLGVGHTHLMLALSITLVSPNSVLLVPGIRWSASRSIA
jgi:hypothetical protein